jgi:hypothetical protein
MLFIVILPNLLSVAYDIRKSVFFLFDVKLKFFITPNM